VKREQAPRDRTTRDLREKIDDRISTSTRSIPRQTNILDSPGAQQSGDGERDVSHLAFRALVSDEETPRVRVPVESVEMPVCARPVETGNEQMAWRRYVRRQPLDRNQSKSPPWRNVQRIQVRPLHNLLHDCVEDGVGGSRPVRATKDQPDAFSTTGHPLLSRNMTTKLAIHNRRVRQSIRKAVDTVTAPDNIFTS